MNERLERLELPPERGSIPRARRFLRTAIKADTNQAAIEIAELLTSELVTNAVLHSGTPLEVRIRSADDSVRVEVIDGTRQPPVLRAHIDPLDLHGRGLQFVEHLAARWGVEADPRGKCVWFELATA